MFLSSRCIEILLSGLNRYKPDADKTDILIWLDEIKCSYLISYTLIWILC